MNNLQKKFQTELRASLKKILGLNNVMQVPSLRKISINMGIAHAIKDPKCLDVHLQELARISGQKPVVTKSKKAIANFKLRENCPIGCMVTLRGKKMYEFIERFIYVTTPRISDFRGYKASFDGRGNCSIGLKNQEMFMELPHTDRAQGMNISFVTTATSPEAGRALLMALGIPFEKKNK